MSKTPRKQKGGKIGWILEVGAPMCQPTVVKELMPLAPDCNDDEDGDDDVYDDNDDDEDDEDDDDDDEDVYDLSLIHI